MNAIAIRNSSKNARLEYTNFDQSKKTPAHMDNVKSPSFTSTESLPAKFNSCENLIECSYGEFEQDLMNGYGFLSLSDSFAQFNDRDLTSTQVIRISS